MNKIVKIAIISGILVFIGAFFVLQNTQGMISVVTAKKPIAQGTKVTSDMLEMKKVSPGAVIPNAIKNETGILGKSLKIDRTTGDQIPKTAITNESISLSDDQVFMNIPLSKEDGSLINAGDQINIITISGSNVQGNTVNDVKVAEIHNLTSSSSGNSDTIATVIVSKKDSIMLAPFIKSNSFKIVKE
jgi:hypothetical protein